MTGSAELLKKSETGSSAKKMLKTGAGRAV